MSKLNFKNDHYDNENEKDSLKDSLNSIQISPDDETNIKKWDEATLNELVYRISMQGVTLTDILKIIDDMKKEKLKYKDIVLRG